jgi:hypothetical protein
MERSETPQAAKRDRDHGMLFLLVVAVLAAYGITSFGVYAVIRVVA